MFFETIDFEQATEMYMKGKIGFGRYRDLFYEAMEQIDPSEYLADSYRNMYKDAVCLRNPEKYFNGEL